MAAQACNLSAGGGAGKGSQLSSAGEFRLKEKPSQKVGRKGMEATMAWVKHRSLVFLQTGVW